MTVHIPGDWAAVRAIDIPLTRFCEEVIHTAQTWKHYLVTLYPDETRNPQYNQQFLQFASYLHKATQALQRYSG